MDRERARDRERRETERERARGREREQERVNGSEMLCTERQSKLNICKHIHIFM